jgi:hypothetical protein
MRLAHLFELALLGTAVGLVGALLTRREASALPVDRFTATRRMMHITMPVQWNGEVGEA